MSEHKEKVEHFKVGQRVKVRWTLAMRAWGFARKTGVVCGGNVLGNRECVQVRLDSGLSQLETRGVHVDHLRKEPTSCRKAKRSSTSR